MIRGDKEEEDAAEGRRRFTHGAESAGDLKKMLKAESSNTMVTFLLLLCCCCVCSSMSSSMIVKVNQYKY